MDTPRPDKERLNKPPTLSDTLQHELSLHPNEASFQDALDDYELHYLNSNFAESMAHYTTVLADANKKLWMNPAEKRPVSSDAAFFRGAIFGLHVSLKMLPNEFTGSVLNTSFGVAPPRHSNNESTDSYYNRVHATVLNQQDNVDNSIAALLPEQRGLLQAAANLAYPKSNEQYKQPKQLELENLHERQFMAGTYYAMWIALHRPIE